MVESRDIKHMVCVERIKHLEEENRKLKDSNTILKKGWQVVFTLEKRIDELLEENKKLNEEIENHKQNIMQDELEIIPKLEEEIKKLKETIKDHQLYEEKLEHRIIEFEELLHWE